MKLRALGLIVVVLFAWVAAGCGSDNGNNGSDKGIALPAGVKGTPTTKVGVANNIGSIDLDVNPSNPSGGQAVAVRTRGHAVQDSHFLTFLHSATSACRGTVAEEFGAGADHAYSQWLDDGAVAAGGNYSSTESFVAGDGVAYRLCAYLQNPTTATALPFAFEQSLICPRGLRESGSGCRPETNGPANLALAANPSNPGTGTTVNVAQSGRANRDGVLEVFRQPADQSCRGTRSSDRQNAGATSLNSRNVNSGDIISETHGFQTSSSLSSYRICGYLGASSDSSTPDATADLLVCSAGATASNNNCLTAPTLVVPTPSPTQSTPSTPSAPPPTSRTSALPRLHCGAGTRLVNRTCVARRHRTRHRRRHRSHK
jgi:hypothetical protein